MQNKVFKAGIGYTLGNYLLKGLAFFSVPIFSRLLEPADYGVFNTYNAYEGILMMFLGCCLHSSLKRAKMKYGNDFKDFMSGCVSFICANTCFWLIVAYFWGNEISQYLILNKIIILVLILQSSSCALIQLYNSYAALYYNYVSFLWISGINAVLNIGLSVAFILTVFYSERAVGRILGNALPAILIGVFLIIYFFRMAKPNLNKKYLKFALNYSLPIVPHGLSQMVLSQFDRIMIASMIGNAEAGLYSFAYNIYSIVMVTVNSLDTVWSTWFFERMAENEREIISKRASEFAFGIMLFCGLILLSSPELIKILGSDKYYDSVNCVIPIVLGGYFAFLYYLPCSIEYYCEKTKMIAAGSMGAAVINILLNYVFIPKYGYIAAAYTTMVTYMLYFIFHYFIAIKILGNCVFNTKQIVLYSLIVCCIGIVSGLFLTDYLVRYLIFFIIFAFLLKHLRKYLNKAYIKE